MEEKRIEAAQPTKQASAKVEEVVARQRRDAARRKALGIDVTGA
jgi:hypothetical protein